jgi:glucose/arabinose dehydrogenase
MAAALILPVFVSCGGGDDHDPGTQPGTFSLATEQVFAGVGSFNQPVLMLQEPSSTARWYVLEQGGAVYVFDNQAGVSTRREYTNVSSLIGGATGSEAGLLGMAFHPGWPGDPRVYVSHTAFDGGQRVTRITELTSTDGGSTASAATARVILQGYQPSAAHNGGHIAFGPDGFLYISRGDGNDDSGPIGNGQRRSTLLGKVLRIDVNGVTGSTPYAIPGGNPFSGNALCNNDTGAFTQDCPEIHAYGFRNPWRWSFDRDSGELWLGDVGEGGWEEINRVTSGGNYGWRCREGAHPFNASCGPNAASAIDPVAEYARQPGNAVTGGYVYRGSAIPQLSGRYVFGDFGSGRIWHIGRDTSPTLQVTQPALSTGLNISSFGQGADGEIYLVHYGGTLHRLTAGD